MKEINTFFLFFTAYIYLYDVKNGKMDKNKQT